MADPNEILRRQQNVLQNQGAQIQSLEKANADLRNTLMDQRNAVRQLQGWVEKASRRIKYIEDIPGKRVPYWMSVQIPMPIPVQPGPLGAVSNFAIGGQELSAVQNVSMDGPFVCTSYMAAFMAKTYSLGPTEARPSDEPAGTEVYTPLTGRFRPVASTNDDFSGAYIGPASPIGITAVSTFRPGEVDFLWQISDQGTDRSRQNMPLPSRFLYSEVDRPLYLPVSDFFERGSTIKVSATPTRDLGTIEMAYVPYNGVQDGGGEPITGEDNNRRVFAIGGVLTFSLVGYKILQAQSPAV